MASGAAVVDGVNVSGPSPRLLVSLLMLGLVAAGCTEKKRTEIILGLATDLRAPVPLTLVNLSAYRLPSVTLIASQDFTISGDVTAVYELPGTFSLYSANGDADRVKVVLTATDNLQHTLVVRSAVLTLVPQRTLFVRLGVVSACVVGQLDCPDGDTCIEGRCAPEEIDTSRLPAYKPGDEKNVACTSGAVFVDTSTKAPLPLVAAADAGTTAECGDGTCSEGVCLAPVPGAFKRTTGLAAAGKYQTGAVRLNDGRVLHTGGLGAGAVPVVASAELYDPRTGIFAPTGSMSIARTMFGEVKLSDGRVLIAGGINEGGIALSTAEIYDPKTAAFTPTAGPMTVGRASPGAVTLGDGRVLIVGGMNQIQSYAAGVTNYVGGLDSAEIFDPTTGTFTAAAGHLLEGRAFPHVVAQPGGGALVLCGAFQGTSRTSIERFDGTTGTFGAAPFATLPVGAAGCESNVADLPDGRLLVTSTAIDTWIFDPIAATFALTGPHPTPIPVQLAAVLTDGQVLFAGAGVNDQDATPIAPGNVAYLFNPATRSFAKVAGGMNVARSNYASALLPSGDVLVIGGDDTGTAEVFHRPGEKPLPPGTTGGGGSSGGGQGGNSVPGGAGSPGTNGVGGGQGIGGTRGIGAGGGAGTGGSGGSGFGGGRGLPPGSGGGAGVGAGAGGGGGNQPSGMGGRQVTGAAGAQGGGGVGGTVGSAGTTGAAGNGGPLLLPDATGWMAPGTNSFNIQGGWFTSADGVTGAAGGGDCQKLGGFAAGQCSTITPPPTGTLPNVGGKMCVSGVAAKVLIGTTGTPDYTNIWGAMSGFQFNGSAGAMSISNPYNAPMNGVKGISFVIDAVPTNGLRVEITTPTTAFAPAYWRGLAVTSPVVAGTNIFHWTDVTGPMYVANPPPFDPTMVATLSFHVITNTTVAGSFAFCISNVTVLTQ